MPKPDAFVRYPYSYGISQRPNEHALALKHGLALMPDNFVCEICWWCEGSGRRNYGGCEICRGSGLLQYGSYPAFDSQRHQVLVAASRSLLIEGVEVL